MNILVVLGVLGLCTQAFASPHHLIVHAQPPSGSAVCSFPDGTTQAELHCYDPDTFLKAYGIDKLHQEGITGKGQTIILVDSYGSPTMQQDLDHFSEKFNLPKTTIKFIYPNGETYVNPLVNSDQLGWAEETTLDLEWAHTVAPDATLVNVITNNSETTGLTGFPDMFKGIQMATAQYPGAIVSMSLGTGEPTFTSDDVKNYLQGSFHQILKQAAKADMTVLASAGDSGSTNAGNDKNLLTVANASYPATDPLITAVGGTALEAGWTWTPGGSAENFWTCRIQGTASCPTDFLNSATSPGTVKETVWKEDWAIAAGGGGVSTVYEAPLYQALVDLRVGGIVKNQRAIPDVSMNAAINGGVDVYTSFVAAPGLGANGPQWQAFGGTSCASPETAALVALAGQKASDTLGRTVGVGFLNPILYALGHDDFNDIVSQSFGTAPEDTINNNGLFFNASILASVGPAAMPSVAVPGYTTTKGYDLATGRGSPRAEKFVHDIARARVLRDLVSP